jgi:sporulation protein YqfC
LKTNRNNKKKNEMEKRDIGSKLFDILELPDEIVMNVPRLMMTGNRGLIVENYRRIIEFETERIRINTKTGIVKIIGNGLLIKEITSENILIGGEIHSIEFKA